MTNLDDIARRIQHRDSDLRLIVSPVVQDEKHSRAASMGLSIDREPDVEDLDFRYRSNHVDHYECPEFVKHDRSTTYELFYDLWFVAVLQVFSESKDITQESSITSYVGYLSILWFTWFVVGIFDVRFITDSLFERVIRTAHLGVMVGFSVVVTYFDPRKQEKHAFQVLSIVLMVSRLVLVVQYGIVLWHVRHYRRGKYPVLIAGGVHFVAAMIYLGVTFRFREGENSSVYIVWYVASACEVVIQLVLGKLFNVLTFEGTHLTERMVVLTVIILGEGVSNIAKNVVLIVKNAAGWTSATIGVLTSAISTMYIFFMIYFDWMNHHHLGSWQQLVWTMLHFPFHVCLLLFMQGTTQFMIWWKALEIKQAVTDDLLNLVYKLSDTSANITTQIVVSSMNDTVNEIFSIYPSKYVLTDQAVDDLLDDVLKNFPDNYFQTSQDLYPNLTEKLEADYFALVDTITVSLFVGFKVDAIEDLNMTEIPDAVAAQEVAVLDINMRFGIVFLYAYITAGLVLMLMTVMSALTRKHWTPFIIFRAVFFFLLGLALTLVDLVSWNADAAKKYLLSPWLLPTISIVFFVVLLLTHLPNRPPMFFKGRIRGERAKTKRSDPVYSTVHVQEVHPQYEVDRDNQVYNPQRWGNAPISHIQYDPNGVYNPYSITNPPPKHD